MAKFGSLLVSFRFKTVFKANAVGPIEVVGVLLLNPELKQLKRSLVHFVPAIEIDHLGRFNYQGNMMDYLISISQKSTQN